MHGHMNVKYFEKYQQDNVVFHMHVYVLYSLLAAKYNDLRM
jgi:hypothetical protein